MRACLPCSHLPLTRAFCTLPTQVWVKFAGFRNDEKSNLNPTDYGARWVFLNEEPAEASDDEPEEEEEGEDEDDEGDSESEDVY